MRKLIIAFMGVMVLTCATVLVAGAQDTETRVRSIAKRLQCPICESISVADSPAELAVQMRGVIKTKVDAGESDEQIIQYFVGRYGEGILLEPPRHGFSALVWVGPFAALAIGVVGLLMILGRRRLTAPAQVSAEDPATEQPWMADAAERELRQLGGR